MAECVFCWPYGGPNEVEADWTAAYAVRPLNPVTNGHMLIVPKGHILDPAEDPLVIGYLFSIAAAWTSRHFNLILNSGTFASQTVGHLHVHIVPREPDDGLMLPWTPNADRENEEADNRTD